MKISVRAWKKMTSQEKLSVVSNAIQNNKSVMGRNRK